MSDETPPPSDPRTPDAGDQPIPVDLRDYVRFDPSGATRVRVFTTDALTLDLWCVEPQQATQVLRYDRADVSYTVIGGRSWFVTDQGEVGLDALGSLLVRAGTAHGIDNRAADPLIVLAMGSPPEGGEAVDSPVVDDARAVRPDPGQSGLVGRLRGLLGP